MTNYKEKYPIGSQWLHKDTGGQRCVIVGYQNARLEVYHTLGKVTTSEGVKTFESSYSPWKEKRDFEDEVLIVDEGEYGTGFYFRRNDLGDCTDGEVESQYKIIARKKITITEGEGV